MLAAIGAGLILQSALRPRPGERLPRGGVRTAGWWLSATGLSGAVVGVLQELTRRRRDVQDLSIPVAPFAGAALATVNDFRRRPWEARSPGLPADEGAPVSAAKSLAMSLGVSAGLAGLAAGERLFAAAVGGLAERGLPGHERLYRPLGHLVALSALGGALYQLMRRADHRIERGPSRSRRPSTSRPPARWSAAAPGAWSPGRPSAARAGATWPPRCAPGRSSGSWESRRPPSMSAYSTTALPALYANATASRPAVKSCDADTVMTPARIGPAQGA